MKKYLLLLVLILLSSFVLAVQVNPGSYFVPSESNYSYDFAQTMYATNITVDTLCMNVTGGEWGGDYCNVSATPTNFTFNSSPDINLSDNSNASYPEVGDNITLNVIANDNWALKNLTLELNDNGTWQTLSELDYLEYEYQEDPNATATQYTVTNHSDTTNTINLVYVNYTIPSDTYGAIWMVKHGENGDIYNITVPNDCYYQDEQLSFAISTAASRNIGAGPFNTSTINSSLYCYDGGDWQQVGNTYNGTNNGTAAFNGDYFGRMYDGDWDTAASTLQNAGFNGWGLTSMSNGASYISSSYFYEEAMYWIKSNTSTPINYSYNWTVRNENANVSYRATAWDFTNNSYTESSYFIVADITAPTITLNANNGYSANNDTVISSLLYNLTYNITFSDTNLSTYNISSDCSIAGNIYSSNNTAASNSEIATDTIDLTGLAPQTCSITLTATDGMGNSATQTNNYYIGTVLYIDSNNIYDSSEIDNFNLTVSYISGNLSQIVEQTFNGSGQIENITAGTFNLLFEQLDNYFFNSTLNITIANQSQNYTYNQSQSWIKIQLRDVATDSILPSYNATIRDFNLDLDNASINDPSSFTNPSNAFDNDTSTFAYRTEFTGVGGKANYLGQTFNELYVSYVNISYGYIHDINEDYVVTLQYYDGATWNDGETFHNQVETADANYSSLVYVNQSVQGIRFKFVFGGNAGGYTPTARMYEVNYYYEQPTPFDEDPYKLFLLDANNYTIDFVPGGSYLNFSYDLVTTYLLNNTLTIDVNYAVLMNLYDEATLDLFNISSADEVLFVQNCPDQTTQTVISSNQPLVNITCDYDNLRFILTYGETSYYRTILTDVDDLIDQFNISVYLINLDTTTPVFSSFIIDDLLDEYEGESIWITRDIGNTTAQITADYVDIENKIGAYLIENAEYIITVKSSNQPDLVLGNYFAVTGEDKVLRLYDINLINALPEEGSSKIVTISEQDNDTFVIGTYNDTTNLTANVTFYVWENNTNTTPIFTTTSTSSVVNFMYNASNSGNRTLIAGFDVVYTDNSTESTATVLQIFEELRFQLLDFVSSSTMNWFITLFIGMLALMATIPTGNKTSLILIGFSAVFIIFGLYTLSWGVLGLALLVSLISNVKDGDIRV